MSNVDILNQVVPNDPEWIYQNAMRYKNYKDKINNVKNKVTGVPNLSFMDHIDKTAGDLGAATGLGITMVGAKILGEPIRNPYEPMQRLGLNIKRHGINVLTNPQLAKRYGYGIPIAGAIGGTALVGKGLSSTLPNQEYDDKKYI